MSTIPVERLTILPDPRFDSLRAGVQERLGQIAQRITPGNFLFVLPPAALAGLLDAFTRAGADEGSLWLVDPTDGAHLVPAFNNGPHAAIVMLHRQPVTQGLISMVFANEQPFVFNGDDRRRDRTLDVKIGTSTLAMVAVPFYFLGRCRGVISCVRLARKAAADQPAATTRAEEAQPRFEPEAPIFLQRAAQMLCTAVNLHCLSHLLGIQA